jgi:hypothetical protein
METKNVRKEINDPKITISVKPVDSKNLNLSELKVNRELSNLT